MMKGKVSPTTKDAPHFIPGCGVVGAFILKEKKYGKGDGIS